MNASDDNVPPPQGPLVGVRVLELGVILAGPYVARQLGDFGAEVIKVEAPGHGDTLRDWGAHRADGRALWWPFQSRNKKLITLDLRQPRGQEIARELAACCDVLVENFKPGTLERWGLAPDVLHDRNPGLIVCRVSGYGQTGPLAHRPGYASAGEAAGGIRYLNGFPDQPPPRMGLSMGDTLAALYATQGVLLALYERAANGGRGQVVDVGITDACIAVTESVITEYAKLGVVREPQGVALRHVVPSNLYESRDGRRIVIAANSDSLWRRLAVAMGRPDLGDRFPDDASRRAAVDDLDAVIGAWAASHEYRDLAAALDAADVVFAPVNSARDLVDEPHFRSRDAIIEMHDPELGELLGPGIVPKLSATPGSARFTGSWTLGAHNDEIYGSLLGLSEAERAQLQADGVI